MKTNIRLSQETAPSVRPKDFWIALATAVLMLGVIVIHPMHAAKLSIFSRWFFGGWFLLTWAWALNDMLGYGKAAFSWQRLTQLTGYSLYAGGYLLDLIPIPLVLARNLSMFLIGVSLLLFFFDIRKHREGESDVR